MNKKDGKKRNSKKITKTQTNTSPITSNNYDKRRASQHMLSLVIWLVMTSPFSYVESFDSFLLPIRVECTLVIANYVTCFTICFM